MKKNKRILISLLLVIVMLTLTSSPVLSADVKEEPTAVTEQAGASITSDAVSSDVKEEVVALNVYSLDKSECMIAEYVNTEEFNKASHVKRLNDEEELDTYVFLNSDGTKSVYYMDENVKFVDKNGDVKEKDVSLVKKTDGFSIVRNEFNLHIPNAASSGISMYYNGYDVKLIPQTSVRAVPARQNGDTVVYDGFFGTNTSLVYTPMLSGVKEDVIMKAYIPNAEFRFVLETDGLGLYLGKDGYFLAESEDGEAVLSLGNVIIYDAIGKPDYGTMSVTTVTEGQKYILSLSAPEEFLTDPTTVYPVTIDPTLTVSDTATGDGAIEDTVLFSGRPSKNYGDYKYLSIGYVDSTYGVGRVAVKLPGLYNSVEYLNTHYSDITSVKFYCQDSSGNSAQYVNLHPITGPLWDENTVTYGDSVTYSTTYNWGTSMSSGTWTSFDITVLIQAWKNAVYSSARGFILINSNETSASYKKAPYSSEYTTTSYRPYVVFTYNANGAHDISNGNVTVDVKEGETCQLTATNPYNMGYTWTSSNTAVATVTSTGMVTALKAGNTTITASYYFNGGTVSVTATVYVYIETGAYYIKNNNSDLYLNVVGGKINNYTKVQQMDKYSDSTDDTTKIRQIWRIHHLGEGRYSVRPLLKLDMALDVTDRNADIYNISTLDTLGEVPHHAEWEIIWSNNGYVFKNDGYDDSTLQVANASLASDALVNVGAYTGGASQKWTLERISNPPSGVVMYNASGGNAPSVVHKKMLLDETKTLADLNLAVVSYQTVSTLNLTSWTSSNPAVATVDSNGTVYAQDLGTTIMTASANGKSISYTLTVLLIPEGTYFIKNREKRGFIQIDDNASPNYLQNKAIIEHHEFNGEEYQKWEFIHAEDKYYKIISDKSGLALSVPANKENSSNVTLVQEVYSGLYRQQWEIISTSDGAYKIRARSAPNNYVIRVNDSLLSNGANIQQDSYTNDDNYLDEWFITRGQYTSFVYNYYDKGYPTRYWKSEEASVANIESYMEAVSERYLNLLDLDVTSYTPAYYQSPIDICKGTVNGSNIDTLCSHSGTIHTERDNVLSAFSDYHNNQPNTSYVLWSCHKITSMSDAQKLQENRSCSNGNNVLLLTLFTSNKDQSSKGVLMHELNHQYGAKDHYHEPTTEGDPTTCKFRDVCSECEQPGARPRECVMNNSYIDITNDNAICTECKNDILEYLEEHYS